MNNKHILQALCLLMAPMAMQAQSQSIEGTSYYLPMNGMRFTVKVEKTQYTPGRLCQYTERFMKQSVTQQPSTTYRIIGIAMDPIAKPDASKRFEIIMDKKHTISNIVRKNDTNISRDSRGIFSALKMARV